MESTSIANKIQISKETADLLASTDKSHWFKPRTGTVAAKGKGELKTFWLNVKSQTGSKSISSSSSSLGSVTGPTDMDELISDVDSDDEARQPQATSGKSYRKRLERLVNWNVEQLVLILKQIKQHRREMCARPDPTKVIKSIEQELSGPNSIKTPLDEVVEIIELPNFVTVYEGQDSEEDDTELSESVITQLRNYVFAISLM